MKNDLDEFITSEIAKIKSLISNIEKCSQKLSNEKLKYNNESKKNIKDVSRAEKMALFLEDCYMHTKEDFSKFYPSYPRFTSYDEGRNEVLRLIQQYRKQPKLPVSVSQMRNEVHNAVEQLTELHQLISKEEAIIQELREQEVEMKKKKDQEYERLLEKLHEAESTFQDLHNQNKNNKLKLSDLESKNIEKHNNLIDLQKELKQLNIERENLEKEGSELQKRRKEARDTMNTIRQTEDNLDYLRNEASTLSKQEAEIRATLDKLNSEVESKKMFLIEMLNNIETEENELDELLDKFN